MNDNTTHQRFSPQRDAGERDLMKQDIVVPASVPPRMTALEQHVRRRRDRRHAIRRNVTRYGTTGVLLTVAVVMFARWNGGERDVDVPRGEVVVAASDVTGIEVAPASDSEATGGERQSPKLQLYAKVSRSVPVFDVDETTQQIFHVGWAETQQNVPVDMKYVPTDQQENYHAVLTSDWDFSL